MKEIPLRLTVAGHSDRNETVFGLVDPRMKIKERVIEGFGREWEHFNQHQLNTLERAKIFGDYVQYFSVVEAAGTRRDRGRYRLRERALGCGRSAARGTPPSR